MADMFAPPTKDELFAPPSKAELGAQLAKDMFAPPSEDELFAPPNKSELDEPGFFESQAVTREELEAIGRKHGIMDPARLELFVQRAPLYGGKIEGERQPIRETLGVISEGPLMGIPTAIERKFMASPEEAAALDELNKLVEERKSKGQVVGEIGAGLLTPGVGFLNTPKLAGKLAVAAGTGATGMVAESERGEEIKDAIIGGTAGVVLGGLGEAAVSVLRSAKKAGASKLEKTLLDANTEAVERAEKAVDIGEAEKAATRIGNDDFLSELSALRTVTKADAEVKPLMKEAIEFAEFARASKKPYTPEEAAKVLGELKAQKSAELFNREFLNFKMVKEVRKEMSNVIEREAGFIWPLIRRAATKVVDGQFVAHMIDARNGTKLGVALTDFNKAHNRYTQALAAHVTEATRLNRLAKESKVENDVLYGLLDGTLEPQNFSKEVQDVAASYRKFFDEGAELANSLGVSIKKRKNYVPHHTIELPEYINALRRRERDLGLDLPRMDDETFQSLRSSNKEFDDYVKALEIFDGGKINSSTKMKEAIVATKGEDAVSAQRAYGIASAALKREGDIPMFVRETDVDKLTKRWGMSTYRQAYYEAPMMEMRKARAIAAASGDKTSADYISNLLGDLTGTRKTLASTLQRRTNEFKASMLEKADLASSPSSKKMYQLLGDSPELLKMLLNNVYPNFLGLSPRAALVNMTQPLFMTVPELGPRLGFTLASKGMANFTSKMKNREAYAEELASRGITQAQWTGELVDALRTGLNQHAVYKHSANVMDGITKASMWMFEQSEKFNRALTFEMGEELGNLLIKASKGESSGLTKSAQSFLQKAAPGYRREMESLLKEGAYDKAKDLTTQYLLSKTMFAYNRANMSEFARWLGPSLSVFSKWPLSIAGDIVAKLYREDSKLKASAELSAKYLGPLMAAMVVDKMLTDAAGVDSAKESPELRMLVGARGLAGSAPIQSALGLTKGEFATPPVVSMLNVPFRAMEGDPDAFWKALNESIAAFMPGAGIGRAYYDIMSVKEGEPRKGTYLNRLFPEAGLDETVKEYSPEK